MKARWTLSLPQTSRANPVQYCSTHQKKKIYPLHISARYRDSCMTGPCRTFKSVVSRTCHTNEHVINERVIVWHTNERVTQMSVSLSWALSDTLIWTDERVIPHTYMSRVTHEWVVSRRHYWSYHLLSPSQLVCMCVYMCNKKGGGGEGGKRRGHPKVGIGLLRQVCTDCEVSLAKEPYKMGHFCARESLHQAEKKEENSTSVGREPIYICIFIFTSTEKERGKPTLSPSIYTYIHTYIYIYIYTYIYIHIYI